MPPLLISIYKKIKNSSHAYTWDELTRGSTQITDIANIPLPQFKMQSKIKKLLPI
jgi:hypothetical protein